MRTWAEVGDATRPDLPKPGCQVRLLCGPPAAGKSSYVKLHAQPGDIVIDLDLIASRMGYGRVRPPGMVGRMLEERNRRLAALAYEPPERVAWFIVSAPSQRLRLWWCQQLGVLPEDVILLVPDRAELRRRITNDRSRFRVAQQHLALVDQWFIKEHNNDPGIIKRGHAADGSPLDPLHRWNRE